MIGPWTLLFLLFLLLVDRQVTLADRLNRRNSKNSKAGEGPKQVPMPPPGGCPRQRLPLADQESPRNTVTFWPKLPQSPSYCKSYCTIGRHPQEVTALHRTIRIADRQANPDRKMLI